jgi:hypothetical protein
MLHCTKYVALQQILCDKALFPEPIMVGVTMAPKEDGERQMTKHQNTHAEPANEAPAATHLALTDALDGLQNDMEIREAVREFVKRSAATARDRSAHLHSAATKATGAIETALVTAVSEVAKANREIVNAAYQEIETAFSTVDKLAGAKSFDEAYRTYIAYLRHQHEVGVARAKSVTGFASAKTSEAFEALRDRTTQFLPTWFRAAA